MADTGLFQINDILLDIPPESIQVERRSFNHQWQTLRTRSSMKVKSGFSQVEIKVHVKFTDDVFSTRTGAVANGYRKLRDLVSQFRVVPFCYVENDYLRNSILGGEPNMTMALALKNMEIIKSNDTTNVLDVYFCFCWFNYTPFSRTFSFKRDIFSPSEVKDPRESNAWALLYKAEQNREEYVPIDFLDSATVAHFNQFSQITIKKYAELEKEVAALRSLRGELKGSADSDHNQNPIPAGLQKKLTQELGDEVWAKALTREIFGDTTSMYESKDPVGDALQLINNNIDPGTNSKYNIVVDREHWKAVILSDGKAATIKNVPSLRSEKEEDSEKFGKEDTILLQRKRTLNFDGEGIVVTALSISFENILASLPLIGHPYPTYQHIGSIDARVVLSMVTTNENSIKTLSGFYTIIEEQAHKYRIIPAGHRNLELVNGIVNMCGIKDMLPESLVIETVPGSPGTYIAEFCLVDNPLTSETVETFIPSQSLTNTSDIRLKIAEVLEKNIRLVPSVFERDKGLFGTTLFSSGILQLRELSDKEETGYYQYGGSKDKRKEAFIQLCAEYGRELGRLLGTLFPILSSLKERPLNASSSFSITDFFQLSNRDVVGIEKIQEDISGVLDKLNGRSQIEKVLEASPTNNSPIIQAAIQDLESSEKTLAAYNKLQEVKQSSVLSDSGREESIKNVLAIINSDRNDERLRMMLNNIFADWLKFSNVFLDRIVYTGLIELPEFDEVRILMKDAPVSSGSTCYPDFPLSQIIDILQTSEDPAHISAFRRLSEIYDKTRLSSKNIDISALLNPDFYFYNPQNDLVSELIPRHIIEAAKEGIKDARKVMEKTEGDWFRDSYEKTLLGPEKKDKVDKLLVVKEDLLKKPETRSATNNYKNRLEESIKNRMAPNELVGEAGPSIETTKKNLQKDEKPIIIQGMNIGSDTQNIQSNYRDTVTLSGPKNSHVVKHRFETDDCLDYLPESKYIAPIAAEPNALPVLVWPTFSTVRRISSRFGPRNPPVKGASSNHKGIDLTANVAGGCDGSPVLASADGIIGHVAYSSVEHSPGRKQGNEGVSINIIHTGGLVTKYFHLRWDDLTQDLSDRFWKKGKYVAISEASRRESLKITQGQQLARIGNTGHGSGAHLHFECYINGTAEDPERLLAGDFNPSYGPVIGLDPNNESLLKKSVDQFEKELRSGQGYGMTRAYPTFKLYFIESDSGERKRFGFDDFFSYSSVKEIQVIRSRKIAADLCTIELTNISGVLSNRKFASAIDPNKARDAQGNIVKEDPHTGLESSIASLMLQPGIQIQLRLGYSNNPEELETVFNGIIVDVEFTDTDDLVRITCQSFAIELIQTIQGEVKSFGGIASGDGRTEIILNEMLAAPEVVHFGRWETGDIGLNSQRGLLTNRWRLVPAPQDDNLFPPQGGPLNLFKAILGTSKYVMYNTTIWDVFQEMTLRHPSYVSFPVPYEGKFGPRMTMFFGLPDQLYFARDSTFEEDNIISELKKVVDEEKSNTDRSDQALDKIKNASNKPGASVFVEGLESTQNNKGAKEKDAWFRIMAKQYAMDKAFIKPFRSYHVLTSSLHILKNSISSSSHNTFNAVTVQYSDDSPSFDDDTGEVNFGNLKTFTLKADAAIRDEETRELLAQYPNCVGEEQAKRYAVSLLFNSLKEAYRGNVEIVGNPKIKPYDVCYVFDEYTDMFGPIEVEQVIHKFSQETGFITEITPDLMVHVNQHATLSTSDAMGLIVEHGLKSIGLSSLGSIVGSQTTPLASRIDNLGIPLGAISIGVSIATFSPIATMFFNSSENAISANGTDSIFGLVGVFIFRKLITRTQLAHPFRFSPLVLGSKPMVGGLPNRRTDGSFIQAIGNWFKDTNETAPLALEDFRDRMNPNNWFGQLGEGDFVETYFK